MQEKAFCDNCGIEVEYTIDTKNVHGDFCGKRYSFSSEVAKCSNCGYTLDVPKLTQENLEKLTKCMSGNKCCKSARAEQKNQNIFYSESFRTTLRTPEGTDRFLDTFKISSGHFGQLDIGDKIQIMEGVFNVKWSIAEFDYKCDESNSGSVDFHNIALFPLKGLEVDGDFNKEEYAKKLREVLGDHLKRFPQRQLVDGKYVEVLEDIFIVMDSQRFTDPVTGLTERKVEIYDIPLPLLFSQRVVSDMDNGGSFFLQSISSGGYETYRDRLYKGLTDLKDISRTVYPLIMIG